MKFDLNVRYLACHKDNKVMLSDRPDLIITLLISKLSDENTYCYVYRNGEPTWYNRELLEEDYIKLDTYS